jgi:hypothetical protein
MSEFMRGEITDLQLYNRSTYLTHSLPIRDIPGVELECQEGAQWSGDQVRIVLHFI